MRKFRLIALLVVGPSMLFAQDPANIAYSVLPAVLRAQTPDTRIDLDFHQMPLSQAVQAVADLAAVKIAFGQGVDQSTHVVTIRKKQMTVREALDAVLAGSGMRYLQVGEQIVVESVRAGQQDGIIAGRVLDAKTRQPIVGATVLLGHATQGVVTGPDGAFRLAASAGDHVVHVRSVGKTRQATAVHVAGGKTVTIEVSLEASASVLDQVVVTGTVVATERKAITTPITVITAQDIERRGITRIEQLLRGEVPGVFAMETGSAKYDGFDTVGAMVATPVYARGSSGFGTEGRANPLKTYIDGVELSDPSYLGTIDPQSIERIEIITGPQAATIYGSGAMGGVMQVFTKKGLGNSALDWTAHLRYGILQNDQSDGRTPTHDDRLGFTGGAGPAFSYAANGSYGYSGQWQPALWNRRYGVSLGATHTRGPITANGTFAVTAGANGTFRGSIRTLALRTTGEWSVQNQAFQFIRRTSRFSSQTASLNIDYRMHTMVSHHLTVGRNQTDMNLVPEAPVFDRPADTLYKHITQAGQRTTLGYSVSILPPQWQMLSAALTLGGNGSLGTQTYVNGCMVSQVSTAFLACGTTAVEASKSGGDESWGGFGSLRLGVFDQLYVTLGLRGERNPSYGSAHKIDWTPTNGIGYTVEMERLTVKVLGSYGRATRAPTPAMRLSAISINTGYEPAQYVSQVEAPDLRPEYSRGPQGGVEVYYGNVGHVTLNRFVQKVTDLIQQAAVDTSWGTNISTGTMYGRVVNQYQNVGSLKTQGWEATGALNIAMISLRGTYSWVDSRVVYSYETWYTPGMTFNRLPSHSGNAQLVYSLGPTSVTFVSNYVGAQNRSYTDGRYNTECCNTRFPMYLDVKRLPYPGVYYASRSYIKSDLTVSHRLNRWATATMLMVNLENRSSSEGSWMEPSLGRQTTFGLSIRYPTRP